MQDKLYLCHVCKKTTVTLVPYFIELGRVASDCRPWPSDGKIGICTNCGMVQKLIDAFWKEETTKIYANYNLYHQSNTGTEQPVFDQISGQATPRSKKILNFTINEALLPTNGCMLDVGCGTGVMLQAFSDLLPNWELNGFEPNLKNPKKVLNISGVKQVFNDSLEHITKTYLLQI